MTIPCAKGNPTPQVPTPSVTALIGDQYRETPILQGSADRQVNYLLPDMRRVGAVTTVTTVTAVTGRRCVRPDIWYLAFHKHRAKGFQAYSRSGADTDESSLGFPRWNGSVASPRRTAQSARLSVPR